MLRKNTTINNYANTVILNTSMVQKLVYGNNQDFFYYINDGSATDIFVTQPNQINRGSGYDNNITFIRRSGRNVITFKFEMVMSYIVNNILTSMTIVNIFKDKNQYNVFYMNINKILNKTLTETQYKQIGLNKTIKCVGSAGSIFMDHIYNSIQTTNNMATFARILSTFYRTDMGGYNGSFVQTDGIRFVSDTSLEYTNFATTNTTNNLLELWISGNVDIYLDDSSFTQESLDWFDMTEKKHNLININNPFYINRRLLMLRQLINISEIKSNINKVNTQIDNLIADLQPIILFNTPKIFTSTTGDQFHHICDIPSNILYVDVRYGYQPGGWTSPYLFELHTIRLHNPINFSMSNGGCFGATMVHGGANQWYVKSIINDSKLFFGSWSLANFVIDCVIGYKKIEKKPNYLINNIPPIHINHFIKEVYYA